MWQIRVIALTGVFACTLGGGALGADHPERRLSCVQTQAIYDWEPEDSHGVIVNTTPEKRYRVKFAARCPHMKWSVFVSVTSRPAGPVPCLSPGDVFVFGRGGILPDGRHEDEERCTVRKVEPLAAARSQ